MGVVGLSALLAGGCASWQKSAEGTGDSQDAVALADEPMSTPSRVARDAFNTYDPDLRRDSILRLAGAAFGGDEAYLKLYRHALEDADPTVRAVAAHALAIHGTVADAELLAGKLSDDAPQVRWEAARGLQMIHNPAAARGLVRTAQEDEDVDVRMAATDALGQYAQASVVDALIRVLDDSDFAVARTARTSLETLTGQELGASAGDWLKWSREHAREMFKGQKVYTYQPYVRPTSWMDRTLLWRNFTKENAGPRRPRGLEGTEGAGQEKRDS